MNILKVYLRRRKGKKGEKVKGGKGVFYASCYYPNGRHFFRTSYHFNRPEIIKHIDDYLKKPYRLIDESRVKKKVKK